MSDDPALAPVRRLQPRTLVRLVNDAVDAGLTLVGPAPGGQVGAAYVRWPNGQDGVLTWLPEPVEVDAVRRTAEILTLARARGLPVPAYDLVAEVPGALAIVQERIPGRAPTRATRAVVEAMVALVDGFADLLVEHPDVQTPDLHLRKSGPGFSLHRPLELYDDRTRRLLSWVREVGAATPEPMTGTDLVHLDFHPGNVLVDGAGAIAGIVDWDGIGRGDRLFGLVTLRFAVTNMYGSAGTAAWLDGVLEDVLAPDLLRAYWAAMSLREVDWAIRHHTPADVERVLDLAETRVDR